MDLDKESVFLLKFMLIKKYSWIVPLLLVAASITYCWIILLGNYYNPSWSHYTGLLLFLSVLYLSSKNKTKGIVSLGAYLLLGIFNILTITPRIEKTWITVAGITFPPINLLSLGLLIIYLLVNLPFFIELELDHKKW